MKSAYSRIPGTVACIVVLLLLTAGCSRTPSPDSSTKAKPTATAVMHATVPEMSLEEQVADADVILLGTVVRVRPSKEGIDVNGDLFTKLKARGIDGDKARSNAKAFEKWVYTPLVLSVDEGLKGEVPSGTIEVRTIGGTVDGYSMNAPDLPRIGNQGQYIVFLGQTWDLAYEPLRVYRVQGSDAVLQGPGPPERMPVEEILNVIRTSVRQAGWMIVD